MSGKIVHFEFMGPDGEGLRGFYEDLFGWKAEAVPGFENYHMIGADQTGVGGAVGQGMEQMPAYHTIYVEVDDIDGHLAKVAAGGGSTVVPRTEIPDTVTFALFTDPAGNLVGLVEA